MRDRRGTDRPNVDKDRKLEAARKQRQIRRQSGEPPEKAQMLVSGRFRATDEVDYFQMGRSARNVPGGKRFDMHTVTQGMDLDSGSVNISTGDMHDL